MRRAPLLSAALIGALLCTACAKSEPIEFDVPSGFDAGAARDVADTGNGLWLLSGPSAAARVVAAAEEAAGVTFEAEVLERIPIEQGVSLDGRSIGIVSTSAGRDFHASLSVGDQTGEIVAVDERVWLRGNEAFSRRLGIAPSDDFVCRERALAEIDDFAALADPAEFLRSAMIGLDIGVLEPEGEGADTLSLVLGSGGAPVGELRVARTAAPLPQTLFLEDQSGRIDAAFAWEGAGEVRPPAGAPELGCE